MATPTLYVSSDQFLWILGLIDNSQAGAPYVTNATVTATIADRYGNAIGGTITLSYQSGSQTVNGNTYAGGNYRGVLPHTDPLAAGSKYIVTVTISNGTYQTVKQLTLNAQYDGQT